MRRRARFLRKARELAYRDLGGLVFNLHRFGQRNDELVLGKLSTVGQIDTELRALEGALAERQPVTVLREAGITACARCAAIHSSEDNFCPNCGLPVDLRTDTLIAGAPAGAAAPPQPGQGQQPEPPPGPAPPAPGYAAQPPGQGPPTRAYPPGGASPAEPSPTAPHATIGVGRSPLPPASAALRQQDTILTPPTAAAAGGPAAAPASPAAGEPPGEGENTEILRPPPIP
jgi:hypothetical protein